MTKEISIEEGNLLIRSFHIGKLKFNIQYHDSYDQMMNVVKHINELSIESGYIDNLELFHLRAISLTKKQLFDAILEYVIWFNNQKKQIDQ